MHNDTASFLTRSLLQKLDPFTKSKTPEEKETKLAEKTEEKELSTGMASAWFSRPM